MDFWAKDFWAPGFWADDFWTGLTVDENGLLIWRSRKRATGA